MTDTTTLKTIELDVYEGDGPNDSLAQALFDMGLDGAITYRIVNPRGPGGGNPVIAFTGTDADLRRMLREQYGADGVQGETVEFYMGD